MAERIAENTSETFNLTRCAQRCDVCDPPTAPPRPVYQLTGPHGYVLVCFACLLELVFRAGERPTHLWVTALGENEPPEAPINLDDFRGKT